MDTCHHGRIRCWECARMQELQERVQELEQAYWRGFHDGKRAGEKEAREKAAGVLAFYIESLREVKGIGDALYQRIVEHINTVDVRKNEKVRKGVYDDSYSRRD